MGMGSYAKDGTATIVPLIDEVPDLVRDYSFVATMRGIDRTKALRDANIQSNYIRPYLQHDRMRESVYMNVDGSGDTNYWAERFLGLVEPKSLDPVTLKPLMNSTNEYTAVLPQDFSTFITVLKKKDGIFELLHEQTDDYNKKLADIIRVCFRLDPNELCENLKNSEDLGNTDAIHIGLATPISQKIEGIGKDLHFDERISQYLFRYIDMLRDFTHTGMTGDRLYKNFIRFNRFRHINVPVQDNYEYTLAWSHITETITDGNTVPNGKVWQIKPFFDPDESDPYNPQLADDVGYHHNNDGIDAYHYNSKTGKTTKLVITGLILHTNVNKQYTVTTLAQALGNSPPEDKNYDGFFLPLHLPTLKACDNRAEGYTASKSLILYVESYTKIKLKWYERSDVLKVLQIAVTVLSIVYGGPNGGWANASFQQIAIHIGTMIATALVTGLAIDAIIGVLSDLIGEEAAFYVVTVAAATMATYNAMNTDTTELAVIAADTLTKAIPAAAENYLDEIREKMQGLQDDYAKLLREYEDGMAKIEEILSAGDPSTMAKLLHTTRNQLHNVEKPNEFFARTLNTQQNELAIGLASYYHELFLNIDIRGKFYG